MERNQTLNKSFIQEQSVATVHCVENGTSVTDACRQRGITEQTFYRWKRQYAGMGVPDGRRLKPLEDENKRLESLVADLTRDKPRRQKTMAKTL